ncbi:FecR family protein [Sphingobacterium suaedae]|uniref:FecR family protein n=1 Tax=Sphingobacterium suaedae TaxID=1686402 RepID=A0ABW5KK08_9SPHI
MDKQNQPLQSEGERVKEQDHSLSERLYNRIIDSYNLYETKRLRRVKAMQLVALWIGVVMFTGITMWRATAIWTKNKTIQPQVQLISAFHTSKKITLPDSTVVVLHPKSSLSVVSGFNEKDRSVLLVGGAFFDVKRNPAKPFIVKSSNFTTTVLGTKFAVNASEEGDINSIFLEEGKVSIQIGQNHQILSPEQKFTYHRSTDTWQIQNVKGVSFDMSNGSILLNAVSFEVLQECLNEYFGIKLKTKNAKALAVGYRLRLGLSLDPGAIADILEAVSNCRTAVDRTSINII